MKKKMMAVLTMVVAVGILAVGCGSSDTSSESADSGEASYTIGISQFAEHSSLDNCREGFLLGLAEYGIVEGENLTVEYQNAAADSGTAGLIADSFVSDNVDLICGIATLSAQTAYNAAMDKEIPVIFNAVTDPIAAELANEDGTPVGEITGVSDELAVEKQLEMIREMLPEAKVLGIMYTTSEVNSIAAIEEYEALVGEYGFELVTVGITATSEVSIAADQLLSQVDCITNLTDNTVVSSLATILDKANEKGIPVFGSEIEQVKIGCLAAQGIDYVSLGQQAGEMAAQVLLGESLAS
ncbi:MAG: ABC transporter substrate-binding protein, partial [Eubacteriales bacterium]